MSTQGGDDFGCVHHRRRQPCHLGTLHLGDDGEAGDGAAPGIARPRRNRIKGHLRGDQRGGRIGADDVSDLCLEHLGRRGHRQGAGGGTDPERAQRLVQAGVQRAELEEVEQSLHLGIVGLHREGVEVDVHRGVAAQQHQVEVRASTLLVFDQRSPQLRSLLIGVGEDAIQAAVLVQQLRRRLLPHPRHALQVVAGVATQRRVLRIQRGGDTRLLGDAGLVVQRVVADSTLVVQHLHVRVVHQLIAVAVAGDDHGIVPLALRLLGQRGQQVVGLPTG